LQEDREELLQERERLLRRIEQQEELLTHFLRRASHDLKGPARRVNMLVSMLQDPSLPESERGELLRLLSGTSENLREMVEGLTLLHRARSREVDVREGCSAQACAQQALIGHSFCVDGVEDLPTLAADQSVLTDVFKELVDNARLWSGKGADLALRFTAETQDGGWVIGVYDNGVGLPRPEQCARVMLPFERMTLEGGEHVGLGLSVVTTLAERMGGRAWVEHGPGLHARIWLPTSL
jgi:signal transduction histidine kinase